MADEQAQKRCKFAHVSPCGGKMSKEHYISHGVLKLLFTSGAGTIEGTAWAPDPTDISASSLTAKILCQEHNSLLSHLDTEAIKFVEAVQESQLNLASNQKRMAIKLFNGDKLELWFLKVAFGMWTGGVLAKDGKKLNSEPDPVWAEYLSGTKPLPEKWGLYVRPPDAEFATSATEFECITRICDEHIVRAVDFKIARLPFTLVCGVPDNPEAWGVYRPKGISLASQQVVRVHNFQWTGKFTDKIIQYNRIRDANPPN